MKSGPSESVTQEYPLLAESIRCQLASVQALREEAESIDATDFASRMAVKSLRALENDMRTELRAVDLLGSSADAQFALDGEPVRGHEVPASFLGNFLRLVQDLTYSVAQVLVGHPTDRARIPQSIIAENRLLVLPQFVPGSFGFRVRLPSATELGQIERTADPLTRVCDLLSEDEPPVDLLIHSRVKSHYRKIMELLAEQNASVLVSSRKNARGTRVASQQARQRVEWLDLLQTTTETMTKVGELVGGSIERRRFELRAEDGLFTGQVSERAREQMQALHWGSVVRAELQVVTTEHEEGVGGSAVEFIAESLILEPAA